MKKDKAGNGMKDKWWIFCMLGALFCHIMDVSTSLLSLKYILSSLSAFGFGQVLWIKFSHKERHPIQPLVVSSVFIMSGYGIICIDTFVFGSTLALPGILRYGLFDFYIPLLGFFCLLGLLHAYAKGSGK